LHLYWAHHHTNDLTLALSKARPSTLHYTALQVRDGGPTRQPLTSLCIQGSLQSFTRSHSIFRRLNRPISISLFCLCHHALSASPTRPCQLTPAKRHLTAFCTVMETLNGELLRRLDQRMAQHSNWLASFQSLHMIRFAWSARCVRLPRGSQSLQ